MPSDPSQGMGGQPVMLQMSDLMQLMQSMQGSGGGAPAGAPPTPGAGEATETPKKGGGAKELAAKIDALAMDVAQIKSYIMGAMAATGMPPPSMGAGADQGALPQTPMIPSNIPPGAPPDSGADMGGGGGAPPGAMPPGGPPPGGPPGGGMQVQASVTQPSDAQLLSELITRLNRR
jgi:hypothetical protein